MYVLLEDVIASIREYAQSLEDPNAGAAIHELASWLGASNMPAAVAGFSEPEPEETVEGNVDRVELYPDPPEDPRPKWYARTVDAEGRILHTTNGSFDYDYVYKDASERWPDKTIHQLTKWSDDSIFTENQERNAYPTAAPLRERISPRRMFAA